MSSHSGASSFHDDWGVGPGTEAQGHRGYDFFIPNFKGGPKHCEEVLTFLRKGTKLQKYGRHGTPKTHYFRLSSDDSEVQWESKGRIRRVPLQWIKSVQRGQRTEVFKRHLQPALADLSFSILYVDGAKKDRTLDVICLSEADFEMWFWGVQLVKHYPLGRMPPHVNRSDELRRSAQRDSEDGASLAAAAASERSTVRVSGGSVRQAPRGGPNSATLSGLAPYKKRELGDLYVWGSAAQVDAKEGHVAGLKPQARVSRTTSLTYLDEMLGWQQEAQPVLVKNAECVDVVRAAIATRHAALITRTGELYTWGYGKTGSLGHGSQLSYQSPRQVAKMRGKGILTVSASDGCSAAITSKGALYTWGSGSAGQLGHGSTFPVVEPKQVLAFGNEIKICQVSCGPYHTAAVTSDGCLFTWGNGLFGKLGHGEGRSEFSPRRVAAFDGFTVHQVSCGWWHTAAVAMPNSIVAVRELVTNSSEVSSSAASIVSGTPALDSVNAPPTPGASASAPTITVTTAASADAAALPPPPVLSTLPTSTSMPKLPVNLVSSGPPPSASPAGGPPTSGGLLPSAAYSAAHVHGGPHSVGSSSVAPGEPYLVFSGGEQRRTATGEGLASRSTTAVSLSGGGRSAFEYDTQPPGGMLFTWGGCFDWADPIKPKDGSEGKPAFAKKDNHRGCLGTGDKEGRMLPTRVKGELEQKEVVQVACGWNLTAALTRTGRVYQMGSTGAYNPDDKSVPWEGSTLPVQVDTNLFGLFIEEIACGMHHVVGVASKVSPNGKMPEEGRRTRLMAWGKGNLGQLGNEGQKDCNSPQPVASIDGKRILHVACGGHHTLAVVEHDPKDVRRTPSGTPLQAPSAAPTLATSAINVLGAAPKVATGALMAAPRAGAGALRAGVALVADLGGLFDIHEGPPPPNASAEPHRLGRPHQRVVGMPHQQHPHHLQRSDSDRDSDRQRRSDASAAAAAAAAARRAGRATAAGLHSSGHGLGRAGPSGRRAGHHAPASARPLSSSTGALYASDSAPSNLVSPVHHHHHRHHHRLADSTGVLNGGGGSDAGGGAGGVANGGDEYAGGSSVVSPASTYSNLTTDNVMGMTAHRTLSNEMSESGSHGMMDGMNSVESTADGLAMPASLGAVSYLSASQQHRHARADDLRGGGSVMDGLVSESSFSNTPVNPSSPTAHLDEGAGDPFHFHAQQQQQQAQQLQQGMHPMAALAALQQQQQQQDIGALSSSSNIHAAEGLAMSPREISHRREVSVSSWANRPFEQELLAAASLQHLRPPHAQQPVGGAPALATAPADAAAAAASSLFGAPLPIIREEQRSVSMAGSPTATPAASSALPRMLGSGLHDSGALGSGDHGDVLLAVDDADGEDADNERDNEPSMGLADGGSAFPPNDAASSSSSRIAPTMSGHDTRVSPTPSRSSVEFMRQGSGFNLDRTGSLGGGPGASRYPPQFSPDPEDSPSTSPDHSHPSLVRQPAFAASGSSPGVGPLHHDSPLGRMLSEANANAASVASHALGGGGGGGGSGAVSHTGSCSAGTSPGPASVSGAVDGVVTGGPSGLGPGGLAQNGSSAGQGHHWQEQNLQLQEQVAALTRQVLLLTSLQTQQMVLSQQHAAAAAAGMAVPAAIGGGGGGLAQVSRSFSLVHSPTTSGQQQQWSPSAAMHPQQQQHHHHMQQQQQQLQQPTLVQLPGVGAYSSGVHANNTLMNPLTPASSARGPPSSYGGSNASSARKHHRRAMSMESAQAMGLPGGLTAAQLQHLQYQHMHQHNIPAGLVAAAAAAAAAGGSSTGGGGDDLPPGQLLALPPAGSSSSPSSGMHLLQQQQQYGVLRQKQQAGLEPSSGCWVEEHTPGCGVWLWTRLHSGGGKSDLVKIKFDRDAFSWPAAKQWCQEHEEELKELYNVSEHILGSSGSYVTSEAQLSSSGSVRHRPSAAGAPSSSSSLAAAPDTRGSTSGGGAGPYPPVGRSVSSPYAVGPGHSAGSGGPEDWALGSPMSSLLGLGGGGGLQTAAAGAAAGGSLGGIGVGNVGSQGLSSGDCDTAGFESLRRSFFREQLQAAGRDALGGGGAGGAEGQQGEAQQ